MKLLGYKFQVKQHKIELRNVICASIASRQIIRFHYHGGECIVEPYCLGIPITSNEVDNEALVCFQIGGYNEMGESAGWKLYRARDIADLQVTDEHYSGYRTDYDPAKLGLDIIFCCISGSFNPNRDKTAHLADKSAMSKSHGIREKLAISLLSHNQLMTRFRQSHDLIRAWLSRNIR